MDVWDLCLAASVCVDAHVQLFGHEVAFYQLTAHACKELN